MSLQSVKLPELTLGETGEVIFSEGTAIEETTNPDRDWETR